MTCDLTFCILEKNKNKKRRELNVTHPSDDFPLLVHANVMFALFSFYSDVAPKGFRLNNKKSWERKTIKLIKARNAPSYAQPQITLKKKKLDSKDS